VFLFNHPLPQVVLTAARI